MAFLGKTFNMEDWLPASTKAYIAKNRKKIESLNKAIAAGSVGNWSEQISKAQRNIDYYTKGTGLGYEDWKIKTAQDYIDEHNLSLTSMQLVTNPQLATDPKALAKYTGKPYGGVDYTPGSADWFKLNPTEAPGYIAADTLDKTATVTPPTITGGIDYTFHQGETVDQYNARINQAFQGQGLTYYGGGTGGQPYSPPTTGGTPTTPTTPTAPATTGGVTGGMTAYQQSMLDLLGETKPVKTDRGAMEAEAGLPAKEQLVNDLNAQLADINARATVAMQTIESQAGGRDITGTFLGRQQQEISRRAAIEAAPIQAQLQTASGNLQTAQATLDNAFKDEIRYQEDLAKWNTDRINMVYEFGTADQKARLDQARIDNDYAFTLKRDKINNARDIMNTAMGNGDMDTAAAITELLMNPDSPTFSQDLANLQAGMSGGGGGTAADLKTGRLNEITQTLEASRGEDGYVDPNIYLQERAAAEISSNDFDNRFSYLLSPAEKERLGITEAGESDAIDDLLCKKYGICK